ncbi:MAG: MptD family putative ECF transporter S component [Erysipelotrichaceae bacterium]|nr:MptD family putative ECF transporter S component [Erysipelotrichaceae bacterium]
MKNTLKIKDFVLIALLTALYFIFYMIAMAVSNLLGPLGHAISPGIVSFIAGALILFMTRKVGKMWQFTILTLIVQGIFSLMGGLYIPWLISSLITAIIADLMVSNNKKPSIFKVAIASGIIHVGQAWGAIIPSWFFLEKYRSEWIARGQSASDMDSYIKWTSGIMGGVSTLLVFVMAIAGVYLGYIVLKKHLKEA